MKAGQFQMPSRVNLYLQQSAIAGECEAPRMMAAISLRYFLGISDLFGSRGLYYGEDNLVCCEHCSPLRSSLPFC